MSDVLFINANQIHDTKERSQAARYILEELIRRENIVLEKEIPLKVHFGEDGNTTYIPPYSYDGIIDALCERGIKSSFIETSVLYAGKRAHSKTHEALARSHGFTRLPVIIADGTAGENFCEVRIDGSHFTNCKIGAEFLKYRQMIVLSHFKGHQIAGFGGAIKQLSMGCAAKGGKLEMHRGVKPYVISFLCRSCGICTQNCRTNAITADKKAKIDTSKCTGCGACYALCPHKAIAIYTPISLYSLIFRRKEFYEALAEYALAAQKGKRCIYINFAMNITNGCDCLGRKMTPVLPDIGIFASCDPVAADAACLAASRAVGKNFKGKHQLEHAQKIGLGSMSYRLVEICL
ncbi:MAG: DUF362 domain-containing protein [Synergistes sp.]|nr:DUF362 domain-containing protein [Synergistes sp.]